MNLLRQIGLFALLTLIIGFVPLVMSIVYVVRPTERRLALMRTLSLAGMFSSIAGSAMGFINLFKAVGEREWTTDTYKLLAYGASESLVPIFLGFGSLTVAWLLVTVGMGRKA